MRHGSLTSRLAIPCVIAVATACATPVPPAPAPPAPAHASTPTPASAPAHASAPAPGSAPATTPLRLLAVEPPAGTPVRPRAQFRLVFDREIDARTISAGIAAMEYVDAPEGLLEDPFQYLVVSQRDVSPRMIAMSPPELLPGTTVRLRLLPGLRGRDGSAMESSGAPLLDATWPVLELPP